MITHITLFPSHAPLPAASLNSGSSTITTVVTAAAANTTTTASATAIATADPAFDTFTNPQMTFTVAFPALDAVYYPGGADQLTADLESIVQQGAVVSSTSNVLLTSALVSSAANGTVVSIQVSAKGNV